MFSIDLFGAAVVRKTDSWPACNEFDSSAAEDSPCREGGEARLIFRGSNILPLKWCGSWEREIPVSSLGVELERHPCHLTIVPKFVIRRQKTSSS
ncbi:hypothetical protein TNCV_4845781 [Trichonephila clavipes]|uniref:Uncharacterized protein n=1 Tax=Trichonephila clavipes TaxID=2585209 RepID=A0A8X6WM18_TRICX|nr:hypothetical protein TNCV_4845781 [Trichonephila clavipes]